MRAEYTGTEDVTIDGFVVKAGDVLELTDRQLFELGPKLRPLFRDLAPVETAEDVAVAAGRASRKAKTEAA